MILYGLFATVDDESTISPPCVISGAAHGSRLGTINDAHHIFLYDTRHVYLSSESSILMRVSRKQAETNRKRVVASAARLFRERGIDGVGIADIMAASGLTHGGFYAQFGSKEELAALALVEGTQPVSTDMSATIRDYGVGEAAARYLSAKHRDDPGAGCALAALASDVARREGPARRAFTSALESQVSAMTAELSDVGGSPRAKALVIIAALTGALTLARAVDDPALSDDILAATIALLSRQQGFF